MADLHYEVFDRDNDTDEVVVDYTYEPGCCPHLGSWTYAGDPGYPAEVAIVASKDGKTGNPVTLTEAETTRITEWLVENHKENA